MADGELETLRRQLQRCRMEFEALKANADRTQGLINQSADAQFIIDPEGIIEFANPAAESLVGRDHIELTGQAFTALLEKPLPWQRLLDAQHFAGAQRPLEQRLRSGPGTSLEVELLISEVFLDSGRIYSARLRDISRRKRHERELRDQARRERTLAQLGRLSLSRDEENDFLEEAAKLCRSALDADLSVIYLLSEAEDRLDFRAGDGWTRSLNGFSIPVPSDSPACQALFCDDSALTLNQDVAERLSSHARAEGVTGVLNVRIGDRREPGGVVGVGRREQRPFTEADATFLMSAGNLIAQTLARERAKRRAAENEQRLALALDGADLGMWDLDLNTGETVCNQRYAEMLGCRPGTVPSSRDDFERLLHPQDVSVVNDAVDAHLLGCTDRYRAEFRIQGRQGGRWLWIESRGRVTAWNEDGTPARMTGTHLDVTERKNADDRLRESEERFRRIADTAPMFVWLENAAGERSYVSRSLLEFTGRTLEQELGISWYEGLHPDDRAAVHETTARARRAREPYTVTYRRRKADGEYAWIQETGVPQLEGENDLTGYVAAGVDISEVKAAQRAVEHARDQALAAARAKSEFVANMSHELRTPLNGILGMLDLLHETPLAEDQRDYAGIAVKSGRALLDLINDVLDFSKLEAGQLALEDIDFDCRLLVEDVVEILAEAAHAKGLELACLVSARVPLRLQGDPGRLRQVLLNLVSNAIKFTEHGEVVARVSVDEASDERLRIEIADSGVGIPRERQSAIFDAFAQADSSTTRRFGGTGLGLTICKRLVEQMGGAVGVDSTPGRGSTFWFTLPLREAVLEKAPAFMPLSDIRGLGVALFERNASSRAVIAEYLGQWGAAVTSYGCEAALLQGLLADGAALEVAVLDLRLAEPGAVELIERLRSAPSLASLKLIVATPLAQRGDGELARRLGINGYLVKPVRHRQLHDCIARVMGFDAPDGGALVTRHSLEENASFARRRILVVDDVEVNQKVAVGMLKHLQAMVDTASSGPEALQAVERQRYDLIFMDCQMPGMDGYQTTARIRRQLSGPRHVPIVAMTANALAGDRERCMAAGMDDYLAKPFRPHDLRAVLERWLDPDGPVDGNPPDDDGPKPAAAAGPTADAARDVANDEDDQFDQAAFDALLEIMGADGMNELVAAYREESSEHLQALRDPAAARETITRAAHSLKSSSGNLGARGLQRLCAELEAASRAGEVAEHDARIERIARAHAALMARLAPSTASSSAAGRR